MSLLGTAPGAIARNQDPLELGEGQPREDSTINTQRLAAAAASACLLTAVVSPAQAQAAPASTPAAARGFQLTFTGIVVQAPGPLAKGWPIVQLTMETTCPRNALVLHNLWVAQLSGAVYKPDSSAMAIKCTGVTQVKTISLSKLVATTVPMTPGEATITTTVLDAGARSLRNVTATVKVIDGNAV